MLDLKGGKELQKLLDQLPDQIEVNIVRGGLRAGAKVFLDAIKETVPVESGELKESVRISSGKKRSTIKMVVKVGNEKAWYAHIIERGAKPHSVKKGDKIGREKPGDDKRLHPGVERTDFVKKAYDANDQQAVDAAVEYMRNRLKTKHGLETPDNDEA